MGGNAFKDETRRIKRNEIMGTLNWLQDNWTGAGIQSGDLADHLLGSGGKSQDSGDLDLNLDINAYDQARVAQQMIDLLGEQYVKPRPAHNQIFMAIPIKGDPENGRVQVDLMFGDHEWQKFSYHSAIYDPEQPISYWNYDNKKSSFKGLYRTELVKALVAYNSDWVLEEDGQVIARVGPTFFHDRGCVWRYRYRPMRQDGTARVKEFKEVSHEEFKALYPSSPKAITDVITNPEVLRNMILPKTLYYNRTGDNTATFEILWRTIEVNYERSELPTILKIYLERLNSLKVEIPTDKFKRLGMKV